MKERKMFSQAVLSLVGALVVYFFFRNARSFYFFSLPASFPRPHFDISQNSVGYFVCYALPDGLWLFAFLSLLKYIHLKTKRTAASSYCELLLAVAIAFAHEIGQYCKLTAGTFDKLDLIAYLIFSIIFFSLNDFNEKDNFSSRFRGSLCRICFFSFCKRTAPFKDESKFATTRT